ncbi:MAG: TA system VapC family ribonuclease toxin [Bryobacteraceae bacterium]|nr:TA system VapC family ribonuclease toxin [Bryobacteraceae bacterium]
MKPALLDVNVLIALIDPAHEFHGPAHAWFRRNRRFGWATCPITQNGCVRIMSKPGYPFPGLTTDRVRGILAELTGVAGHVFWPDSLSVLDKTRFRLAGTGPKHLTDIYLLGLAVANGGRLATFDRNIALDHVVGGEPDAIERVAS